MTTLTVKALDPEAPGSFRERSKLFELIEQMGAAQASGSGYEAASAFRLLERVIVPRLATDDGTPVEDVLDRLSANEFDALLAGLAGTQNVPPASASS